MYCPNCRVHLERAKTTAGMVFRCPRCDGRAAGMAVLRHTTEPKFLRELWMQTGGGKSHGAACPVCQKRMAVADVLVGRPPLPLRLDVCRQCQFVWFDPNEYEQMPSAGQQSAPLPQPAREILAMQEIEKVARQAEAEEARQQGPSEAWQWIPGVLGLPVEISTPGLSSWPWLTWGLAAVLAAVFALTAGNLAAAVEAYGFVPAQLWRHGGLTLLSCFFLHADIWHLIGNVYFLLIFGDNVEDDLGPWRWLLLLAAATVAGGLLHAMIEPRQEIPCIGASGGISGIITYYALRFPHARLGIMFRYWWYFRWLNIPAFGALLLWFGLQLLLAYYVHLGLSNVGVLAHLGGAIVGVAAFLLRSCGGRMSQEMV